MQTEWLIPVLIIVLLFGAKKLPELAGSMGKSIKEFRKAADEAETDGTKGAGDSSSDGSSDAPSDAKES